jgi:hypothetical protein
MNLKYDGCIGLKKVMGFKVPYSTHWIVHGILFQSIDFEYQHCR